MKKILLPTDFSFHAFAAYQYANQLAYHYNAEIILLHVISGSFNTGEVLDFTPLKQAEDAMIQRLKYFSSEYPHEEEISLKKVPTSHEVRFGVAGFTITDFARDNDVDMIVMGSREKHGVFDRILGSASSVVISTSSCPMMFIHEQTKYHDFKKIVFGFDGVESLEESIKYLKKFNFNQQAGIDFVHVIDDDDKDLPQAINEIVEEMIENQGVSYPFLIKKIPGRDPEHTLMDYCINEKADLLVVYHRKSRFLERIFRRSHSVMLAQNLALPVLVLPDSV